MKEHLNNLRRLLKPEPSFIDRLENGDLTKEDYDRVADLADPSCHRCVNGLIEVTDVPPIETGRPIKVSEEICDCVWDLLFSQDNE